MLCFCCTNLWHSKNLTNKRNMHCKICMYDCIYVYFYFPIHSGKMKVLLHCMQNVFAYAFRKYRRKREGGCILILNAVPQQTWQLCNCLARTPLCMKKYIYNIHECLKRVSCLCSAHPDVSFMPSIYNIHIFWYEWNKHLV